MKRQRSKIIRQSAIGVKGKGALKICARRKAPKKCSMAFMKAKLLRRSESLEYCTVPKGESVSQLPCAQL